jgi:glycosyltransferase involved in cell wall biosynthesis
MRIVIDLQGAQCGSRHRGIGRYSLALTQALLRLRGEHEVFVLLNGLFADTIGPLRESLAPWLDADHVRVWDAQGPVASTDPRNDVRRKLAELTREAAIAGLQPDVVLVTSFFEGFGDNATLSLGRLPCGALQAAVFYDAIPLIESKAYLSHAALDQAYRAKARALARADLLLSISESSRQEAIAHLGMAPERVVNISAAADDCFTPEPVPDALAAALRQRLGIHRPFVLCSGASDARKNHFRLLSAFAHLEPAVRASHQLVMVGEVPGSHRRQVERHMRDRGLRDGEVVWTGRLSDEDLRRLYVLCTLFVFPSWHEGFGLPALEAMRCGAAVIGANTTSVPEVISADWALFDPFDEAAIGARMQEMLTQPGLRARLSAHGLQQAERFSWEVTAQRALAAMEEASRSMRCPAPSVQALSSALTAQFAELNTSLARQDDQLRTGRYALSVGAARRALMLALGRRLATMTRRLRQRLGR